MTEKQQCHQLLDYYNRALTLKEHEEFEKHLETCADCKQALQELEELHDIMPYASPSLTPPKQMKERIFSNILGDELQEKKRKRVIFKGLNPLLVACLLLSLLGNLWAYVSLTSEEAPEEAVQVINTNKRVALNPMDNQGQGAAALIENGQQRQLVVEVSGMPQTKGDETLQVWLLKDGKPYRSGTFVPNNAGEGAVVFTLDKTMAEQEWDTVAITHEPTPTSETPQGQMLMASDF
ncbi:anti-sigma factor [Bacillus tianshenii]|nr:anti-sigma factor [Bacillus tianshenii]